MQCRECKTENKNSAKYCKKCGAPLVSNTMTHESIINKTNKNNNTKIIIVALIIVCLVLAASLIYFFGFNQNNNGVAVNDTVNNTNVSVESVDEDNQQNDDSEIVPQTSEVTKTVSDLAILGGTFSTGSKMSDKTYASIYVGSQHAGEKVKIQIKYSRDGNSLNKGNKVPKTVDSSGYINVKSAQAYSKYPDFAEINIFDTNGNLLATQGVYLNPDSGSQSF